MRDDANAGRSRRRFLAAATTVGIASVAGCGGGADTNGTETDSGNGGDDGGDGETGDAAVGQIGSGNVGDRDISGGVSMGEMPDLSC